MVDNMPNSGVKITDDPLTDKSVYGRMGLIEVNDKDQDERLDQHALMLERHTQEIAQIKENNLKLENLVMNENRETRSTITNTNQQLHTLIENLLGYKSGQNQLETSLKLAKRESWAKIVGILTGSGGILVYIFDKI